MKIAINKAQLALIFDGLAAMSRKDIQRTAEAYTECNCPISASELQLHFELLIGSLSEVVEVEDWNWKNNDNTIDCYHDENGDEF